MPSRMSIDQDLVAEAHRLTDGSDIHDILGLVAMYRSAVKEGVESVAAEFERGLRSYVVSKRVQRTLERAGEFSH
jgi:hypothetical protein